MCASKYQAIDSKYRIRLDATRFCCRYNSLYAWSPDPSSLLDQGGSGVKMQSNGHSTFWGLVKRSSTVLGHYHSSTWQSRGVADLLHMHKGQGAKIWLVWRTSPFTREEGSGVMPIRELFQCLCNTYGYATKT